MASTPLFTVVEVGTNKEIKLVDDTGVGCAVPMQQGFRDEDHRYNYTDGSVGRSPVVQRHEITLACDWLTDATRRNLVRLMMDRSRVLFTPGFSDYSVMAWRPVHVDGTTLPSGATWKDLTGQVSLTNAGGANQMVWNHWQGKGEMIEPDATATAPALIVETPHGAGQSMQRTSTNRWTPDYPESATSGYGTGNAGWGKWGADAAQITFTHVSGGGLATDCPDALRVTTTADIGSARAIGAFNLWDSTHGDYAGYTFTSNGMICASVWVKGRFSPGNTFSLSAIPVGGGAGTVLDSIDLDTEYTGWTKLSLNGYSTSWASYIPSVQISLPSAAGETADFLIGPQFIGSMNYWATDARWSEYGAGSTSEQVSCSSITKPKAGSVTASFYIPEGVDLHESGRWTLATLGSDYNGALTLFGSATAGQVRVRFYYDATNYVYGNMSCAPGAHAITVSWGTGYLAIFADGESIYENSSASGIDFDFLDDGEVYIAQSSYGCWPLIPLTMRLDEEQHRADYAGIHAALTDSVSLGTITAARGRQYEIRSIPSTPRMSDGATFWIGNLVLSQVDYDSDSEDVTTKEVD